MTRGARRKPTLGGCSLVPTAEPSVRYGYVRARRFARLDGRAGTRSAGRREPVRSARWGALRDAGAADHQDALGRLFVAIDQYVGASRLGWALFSPADIVFSPRRLVQPDLFVVPWRSEGKPHAWSEVKSLLLAVEILSPSTAHADRFRKRLIYQDEGVSEYWVVDLDARLVERWRPSDLRPEIVAGTLEWRPRAGIDPLRMDLPALFQDVLGSGAPSPPSREGDDMR